MDCFGAFGELPFATIPASASQASVGSIILLTLPTDDEWVYYVELYPFQDPDA